MGATSNRRIGLETRDVITGGVHSSVYLISACASNSAGPAHVFVDMTPTYDSVDELIAAGWAAKWTTLLTICAAVDLPSGGDVVRAYIENAFEPEAWDDIMALGETDAIALLMLLKGKADAGLVTL